MDATMKAVLIREYGNNEVVRLAEVNRPVPQVGELLLQVRAAGVNPIDWKIRDGAGERLGMALPIRMGSELVGTVAALGDDVDGFEIGDIVFGMVQTGAFAEWAVARAADMARAPSTIGVVEAAALPLAATTAWQALFNVAALRSGQRVLITNGSGGVGSLAVQIAKAKGAHVTAMASGRNADYVLGLGADAFVDYTTGLFEETVRDMDIVFDTVGGDTFQRGFKSLKPGGFMVTIVAFPGDEAKRYSVGVDRSFTKPSAAILNEITALVEAGLVVPRVQTTLPLKDVRMALDLSATGRTRGKIVLQIAE